MNALNPSVLGRRESPSTPSAKFSGGSEKLLTKVLTATLYVGNERFVLSSGNSAFGEIPKSEAKNSLLELFKAAIKIIDADIKNIQQLDPGAATPINRGPHYDNIVCEFAVYINEAAEVSLNVAFGLGANAENPLVQSLKIPLRGAIEYYQHFKAVDPNRLRF